MPHRSSATVNPNHVHVIGIGRSGTSWLLKIFDHHPATLALHEPELVLRKSMQRLAARAIASPDRFAGAELERDRRALLFRNRPLRAVRRRPILRKGTRSRFAHTARNLLIFGLSALERTAPKAIAEALRAAPVPDLGRPPTHVVVKSVGLLNDLEAYAAANPDLHIVFVIRHPCANALSIRTGQDRGMMSGTYLPPRSLIDRYFRFGKPASELTESDFAPEEVIALRWAVYNQVMEDLSEQYDHVSLVVYDDLCERPIHVARDLFARVGVPWHLDVERFLSASLAHEGLGDGYHAVIRNPVAARDRWRETLPHDQREAILRIVRQVPVSSRFKDF